MTLNSAVYKLTSQIEVAVKNLASRNELYVRVTKENTIRLETIQWLKEKQVQLNKQRKELKSHKSQLLKRDQDGQISSESIAVMVKIQLEKLLNAEKYEKAFLLIFCQYLERLRKDFQTIHSKTEGYINCFSYVKIKPSLPKVQEQTIHLIIDHQTTFYMLKDIIVPFWNLEDQLSTPTNIISNFDLIRDLIIVDEQYALIPADDLIIPFFQHQGFLTAHDQILLLVESNLQKEYINSIERESKIIFSTIQIFVCKEVKEK